MRKGHTFQNLYTDEDDKYIKEHYKETPIEEMAEHLNRSVWSLRQHMASMMLAKKPSIDSYRSLICKYAWEGYGATPIANKLGYTPQGVVKFCKKMGITIKKDKNSRREIED